MANPHKGQVALNVDGREYTLSFSINALCELEDALGESVNAIAAQMGDGSKVRLKTIRTLVWAALRDHHPETSVEDAGEIIGAAGVPATMEAIGEAFAKAFPDVQEGKANGSRPRKAAAGGTG